MCFILPLVRQVHLGCVSSGLLNVKRAGEGVLRPDVHQTVVSTKCNDSAFVAILCVNLRQLCENVVVKAIHRNFGPHALTSKN
jgi:hypothetical protein